MAEGRWEWLLGDKTRESASQKSLWEGSRIRAKVGVHVWDVRMGCPSGLISQMFQNDPLYALMCADVDDP
ncbi:hypothetical protein COLO4_00071 [Corchorus olitorius]|uniref:Uncharacterized protein n=1 Tax=Corchorus olitorius TaxID=93759 RepID=A0A1R3L4S4_9ROSI|nr:hypothetical protein COLO4_00071 [Corchorus olitorius]